MHAPSRSLRFAQRALLAATLVIPALGSAATATADDRRPTVTSAPTPAASAEQAASEDEAAPRDALQDELTSQEPRAESGQQPGQDLSDEDLQRLMQAIGLDQAPEGDPAAPVNGDLLPPPAPVPVTGRGGFAGFVQSMNPDMSLILDVAAAWFSNEPMQLGAHDPNRTGFTFQQLEMHLSAAVDPFFRLDANLVFSQFGVEVEEAFATTTSLPGRTQLRFGQFLTSFGRLNPTHPHSWHFADQPIPNGKFFGGEGSRGLGVEGSWLAPLPWYVELIASANDAAGACCARSFYGGEDLGVRAIGDFLYTLAVRQFFDLNPDWGLGWGITGQFGPNPTGLNNRSEIYGTDVYLRYRPVNSPVRTTVSLTAELMHRRRQIPGDLLADWGGYTQIVWNIVPRWEVGARYDFATGLDNDPLDPEWVSARHRASVQGTFYPSHFSRVRVQLNYDRPTWMDEPIFATILATELLVGAHGAHDY